MPMLHSSGYQSANHIMIQMETEFGMISLNQFFGIVMVKKPELS